MSKKSIHSYVRHLCVALLLLLGLSAQAQTQIAPVTTTGYVITATHQGRLNNYTRFLACDGSSITADETFNASTCIWEANQYNHLYCNGKYLSLTNGSELGVANNGMIWNIDNSNGYIYATVANGKTYYLKLNASFSFLSGLTCSWSADTSTSGTNTGVATAGTITRQAAWLTLSDITGSSSIDAAGTYNYSATATYQPEYAIYNFGSTHSSGTQLAQQNPNVTWSMTGAPSGASINNNGVITLTSIPANNATATITATATAGGITQTKQMQVTFVSKPAQPEIFCSSNIITMSSASGSNVRIYYITSASLIADGTNPTNASSQYSRGFLMPYDHTYVKAIAYNPTTREYSTVASADFQKSVAAPTIVRNADNTVTISTTTDGATLCYSTTAALTACGTGDNCHVASSTSVTPAPFNLSALTEETTIYAITCLGTTTQTSQATFKPILAAPKISITDGGQVTISAPTGVTYPTNTTIYYTTNGNTPTTSSTAYTAAFSLEGSTVKAIAVCANYDNSPVATKDWEGMTGVRGGKVILYDYEDHNWTYYQTVANGGVAGLNSPDPRNVKITYEGNGGAVSINDPETTFVYYKTIEKVGGKYSYELIPNPFSKRPSTGSGDNKKYYGCRSWKVKSVTGGTIKSANGNNTYAVNSTIDAETSIQFVPTSAYTPNCTSMEVVFEANWEEAYVYTYNGTNTRPAPTKNHYELNFVVIDKTSSTDASEFQLNKPATITMVYPDGTNDKRSNNNNYLKGNFTASANTKFEYCNINATSGTFTANNNNLIIGRGVSNTNSSNATIMYFRGLSSNPSSNIDYKVRIESGTIKYLSLVDGVDSTELSSSVEYSKEVDGIVYVLGCDYDRAGLDNEKLKVVREMYFGYCPNNNGVGLTNTNNKTKHVMDCTIKSGRYISSKNNNIADASESFYCSIGGHQCQPGKRYLTIEGGNMLSIAGGIDEQNNAGDTTLTIRIKGGTIRGSVYGAAAFAATKGHRKIIATGGTIKGWIAGGCNGTNPSASGGTLPSNTYVYIGGRAEVNSNGNTTAINTSLGGNVFGAGSGNSAQATTGQVNNSNVVVADNAYIERNVYGGGNYGYTSETAKIYIKGGRVGGRVFGGSNRKQGTDAYIYMSNGVIDTGIYGGSNITGTLSGSTDIQISGGVVGVKETVNSHVCGGGYGYETRVANNVKVTISDDATIYGDVYGGSEQGLVNSNAIATTTPAVSGNYASGKKVEVIVTGGKVTGGVYGGGLGVKAGTGVVERKANTYGATTVKVSGGEVNQVFGCNNQNGEPADRNVEVEISGTAKVNEVFGGGNAASYGANNSAVQTKVLVKGGTTGNVYGGGLGRDAKVTGTTDVKVQGSAVVTGNVYGGGLGAEVSGNTNVQIGGTTSSN